jgi:hypothetical protein
VLARASRPARWRWVLNDTEREEPPLDTTVVVPAWGPYVGEPLLDALESLRRQDDSAHLVVVDNASDEPLASLEASNWFALRAGSPWGRLRPRGQRREHLGGIDGGDLPRVDGPVGGVRPGREKHPQRRRSRGHEGERRWATTALDREGERVHRDRSRSQASPGDALSAR